MIDTGQRCLLAAANYRYPTIIMPYLPRPDIERVTADVDEIYLLAAEELQRSLTAEERRNAFKQAMLRCYDAGVDAQREIVRDYDHERPTPLPQPLPTSNGHDKDPDPGMLPSRPRTMPYKVTTRTSKPPRDDD